MNAKYLEWVHTECIFDLQSLQEIWKQKESNGSNKKPSKVEGYFGKHQVSKYKGES